MQGRGSGYQEGKDQAVEKMEGGGWEKQDSKKMNVERWSKRIQFQTWAEGGRDAASRRGGCAGEPMRSPATNVVSPLYATIESTARWAHMSLSADSIRAQGTQTGRWVMKDKVIPAGMAPAEMGGEQSVCSLFENLIFPLNYWSNVTWVCLRLQRHIAPAFLIWEAFSQGRFVFWCAMCSTATECWDLHTQTMKLTQLACFPCFFFASLFYFITNLKKNLIQ